MVREFLSFLIDAFSIEKFMKRDRKTVTELGNGTFNGEAGLQLHTVGIFQPIWIQYFSVVSLSSYKDTKYIWPFKLEINSMWFWLFLHFLFSQTSFKKISFNVREDFFSRLEKTFFQSSRRFLSRFKKISFEVREDFFWEDFFQEYFFEKISFEKIFLRRFLSRRFHFWGSKRFVFIVWEEFFAEDFFQGSTNILALMKLKSLLHISEIKNTTMILVKYCIKSVE